MHYIQDAKECVQLMSAESVRNLTDKPLSYKKGTFRKILYLYDREFLYHLRQKSVCCSTDIDRHYAARTHSVHLFSS